MKTLVIRFSSLGDIVLAGAVTAALQDVEFLTLDRYAELAERLPGVRKVHTWEAKGREATLGFDRIIDLHASPRSRWATAFRHAEVRRVERFDLRRRARPSLKVSPPPSVIDRYAKAADVVPHAAPWLPQASGHALLLMPLAAHATKTWPASRYVQLGRRWSGPVKVLGSFRERKRLSPIAQAIGDNAKLVTENGFAATFEAMQSGRVAVGGDTGLTHLAVASGIPTIGIFGPTTSTDGFWTHGGVAIENDLPCRPCSRHGTEACPTGDHACLDTIDADQVWDTIERLA